MTVQLQVTFMDDDYVPPPEPVLRKRKGPKSKPPQRAKRNTLLSQLWPRIKALALKGNSPMEIAEIVNAKQPEKNHLTNQQISNLIGRKRKEGEIAQLSVTHHGGLQATKADCMKLEFLLFVFYYLFKCICFTLAHVLAKWSRIAKDTAEAEDEVESLGEEDTDSEEAAREDMLFLDHGSSFLRFRWHATRTHFYIICEACVDRNWNAKVDDYDDDKIVLTVTMKSPKFDILDKLFPTRVEFHFEGDEDQVYQFTLEAERKLKRLPPVTSFSPTADTPLWYGFAFEFAEDLPNTNAANVDFSDLLNDPELRVKAKKLKTG